MTLKEAMEWLEAVKKGLEYKKLIHYKEEVKAVQLGFEALQFKKEIYTRIEASLYCLVCDDGTWDWDLWEQFKSGNRLPSETYIPESVGVVPTDEG